MRRGRPPYPGLLTPREQEVLDLVRQGLTNRQIADRLRVSLATANYHVSENVLYMGHYAWDQLFDWWQPRE